MLRIPLAVLTITLLAIGLAACDGGAASDGAGQLPDDVAATVNGQAIPAADVDAGVEAALSRPTLVDTEDEGIRREVAARVLTQMIIHEIVHQGAADLGVAATPEEIAEAHAEFVASLGGDDALEQHLETTGVTEEQLEHEIEALVLIHLVGRNLAGPEADDATVQEAARQWVEESRASASIIVADRYGAWDRDAGRVNENSGGRGTAQRGGILSAPSSRITSPFRYGFSTT